ncbi:MAG TPA: aldehyde dehydrogenase family protein, partial [Chitinophagaceae bacterium]|nr:aldehyde dehydrogenase family protein [Chitinophagaceae bacterium]
LIHASKKDEFVQALRGSLQSFFGDDPASSYNYGKIINEKQFNRLITYLSQGNILHGGKHDISKLFIEPTIIEPGSLNSPLMTDEIFGPIVPVITYEDPADAVVIIHRNPNPLAFYVFTSSSKKEKWWLEEVRFGGGCVNNASWHLTNHHLPFGGRGNSGIGHYHGKFSFDTFSHHKAIMKTPTWFDPAIKYPPFKGKLGLFKKIIR